MYDSLISDVLIDWSRQIFVVKDVRCFNFLKQIIVDMFFLFFFVFFFCFVFSRSRGKIRKL